MEFDPQSRLNDPPRRALAALVESRGADLASLSRLLGRNAAYIHQYLYRGSPRQLGERERAMLARYFGVDEQQLGGPRRAGPTLTLVPRLDVGASAGGGGLTDDEPELAPFAFDPDWLRRLSAAPQRLAIIRVEGDSMAPTLVHGEEIMVDSSDGADRLRDGIYVLRRDAVLLVKRLALGRSRQQVSIISDNAAYPTDIDVPLVTLDIIGRVLWAARPIG
jgi:phage repressor protein C with HTH and peptisase S24 domain